MCKHNTFPPYENEKIKISLNKKKEEKDLTFLRKIRGKRFQGSLKNLLYYCCGQKFMA
jgi:hypothetical protein